MSTLPKEPTKLDYVSRANLTRFLISLSGGNPHDDEDFDFFALYEQGFLPLEAAREYLNKVYGYTGQ
jgi:hypothetical protein